MKLKFLPDNIFFVGGTVRDNILNLPINDFDFVIKTSLEKFSEEANNFIKKNFNKNAFLIGKDYPPTMRAVIKDKQVVDITLMINNFKEDACRRDFTINSLFMPLDKSKIIDPLNVKDDFFSKKIRQTTEHSFKDDPLRMIRAIRLIGQLKNFTLDKGTFENIKFYKSLIKKVAVERVRDELEKIFLFEKRYFLVKYLYVTGLLFEIFPELKLIENLPQKKNFHKFDVFNHSLNILKYIDNNLSSEEKIIYSYTALFHDIGKYYSSYRHTEYSLKIAKKIMKRLKVEKKISQIVLGIVENHMRILQISLNKIKEKTLKKFVFEKRDIIDFLIKFAILESYTKTNQSKVFSTIEKIREIIKEYDMQKEFIFSSVKGEDLIRLGVKQDKIFGEILNQIRFEIFRDNLRDEKEIYKRLNGIVKEKKIS